MPTDEATVTLSWSVQIFGDGRFTGYGATPGEALDAFFGKMKARVEASMHDARKLDDEYGQLRRAVEASLAD